MGKSKSKTYTISEMASICNVSPASVSKYVKRNGLKPVETGQNNAKLFSSKDFEAIKEYYREKQVNSATGHTQNTKSDIIDALKASNEQQADTIEMLKKQLEEKDKQLERQSHQIDNLTVAVGDIGNLTKQVASLTSNAQQLQLAEKITKADNVDNKKNVNDETHKHGFWWRLTH